MTRSNPWLPSRRTMAGFVLSAVALTTAAAGESYPSRPVKLVVPFPGGGPLDFTARLLAERLAASLKQPFVVENRPGGSGLVGTDAVAKASPDGYTLLVVIETPLTVAPSLHTKLAFDPSRDFTPIATIGHFSQTLVVHPSMPANSLAEFIAYAKAHNDRPIVYGSGGGRGDPGHLSMEYLRMEAGFEGVHVPFKGNAEVVTNLVGGQILAGFLATPGVLPFVRDGRLKALAISSGERSPFMPDIPTVSESGFRGFELEFHQVLLAPANLPESIRAVLEREVRAAMQSPDVQARLRALALEPSFYGSTETRALLETATKRWRTVIANARIRMD